jgi:hypothetical protein
VLAVPEYNPCLEDQTIALLDNIQGSWLSFSATLVAYSTLNSHCVFCKHAILYSQLPTSCDLEPEVGLWEAFNFVHLKMFTAEKTGLSSHCLFCTHPTFHFCTDDESRQFI